MNSDSVKIDWSTVNNIAVAGPVDTCRESVNLVAYCS
jgi:hypothetical protein